MYKVSVIVPCYKVEKYLQQCIDSLTHQTLKEIQIILVDDGSPDNSGAICDKAAACDSRITVIHKENGGVSAARNDGLAMATGEYVIFVDSDDYMSKRACQVLYEKAKSSHADVVIGDVYRVFDDRLEYCAFYGKPFETADMKLIKELIKADMYKTYCPMPSEKGVAFGYGGPWNKLVKRSFLIDNNICFDVRLKGIFDDIIYSAYLLANARKVAYVQAPVYYYRIIGSSITATYKANMLEINNSIIMVWNEFLKKFNKNKEFDAAYSANIVRRIDESLGKYFFNEKSPNSLNESLGELRNVLKQKPYYNALRKVEFKKLTTRHKILVILCRTNCIRMIPRLFANN